MFLFLLILYFRSEREKYYKHAMKARRNPDKYLSIIMDAMDQAKTMIPHFTATPKFADGMWKLKTHLLGAIVHGIGAYGFFDIFQWPHGSNLTVSTLMNILFMMKDSLPEVLYLQMDNCGRENKNRYDYYIKNSDKCNAQIEISKIHHCLILMYLFHRNETDFVIINCFK